MAYVSVVNEFSHVFTKLELEHRYNADKSRQYLGYLYLIPRADFF